MSVLGFKSLRFQWYEFSIWWILEATSAQSSHSHLYLISAIFSGQTHLLFHRVFRCFGIIFYDWNNKIIVIFDEFIYFFNTITVLIIFTIKPKTIHYCRLSDKKVPPLIPSLSIFRNQLIVVVIYLPIFSFLWKIFKNHLH